ncbi:MAG: NAD(P)H-dependent oxidoreductase subunit E [Deltaproteobacteria bacterium]|nr:MAG: NAD(P)H-dependent oxidoreductase subunit E [Deltaproteobacteria bacterium]
MTTEDSKEKEKLEKFITGYLEGEGKDRNLICALLAVQNEFGYLPPRAMELLAEHFGLTPANVYGVATFYNQFRFTPPGKHNIQVCMGTACHIKQAAKILDHFERRLGIKVGGVTADREYSLDRVACVGCCTLAPVAVIDGEVNGYMSTSKIDGILLRHELERGKSKEKEQAGTSS